MLDFWLWLLIRTFIFHNDWFWSLGHHDGPERAIRILSLSLREMWQYSHNCRGCLDNYPCFKRLQNLLIWWSFNPVIYIPSERNCLDFSIRYQLMVFYPRWNPIIPSLYNLSLRDVHRSGLLRPLFRYWFVARQYIQCSYFWYHFPIRGAECLHVREK